MTTEEKKIAVYDNSMKIEGLNNNIQALQENINQLNAENAELIKEIKEAEDGSEEQS